MRGVKRAIRAGGSGLTRFAVCKHHVIIAHIYKYNYMLIQTQNNALLSCLFMYTY